MRKKRLLLNTTASIINQIIAIVCGFILPRQILLSFGSEVNGLVSSITQFLGFISIMDMGVGAVVQSALYKPLADCDHEKISQIMSAARKFFNRIAVILGIYTILLMIVYPLVVSSEMGWLGTAVLIFSISLSMIAQYFLGITNQLLLNADQKSYIRFFTAAATTVLNTGLGVFCIKAGASIQTVKLVSSLVLLLRPLILYFYVQRNYRINYKITYEKDPIRQKWDALYQHIATFIVDKTDIIVLTLFSSLTNISIYTVYHLVVNALYQCFVTVTAGVQSLLGDMIARKEEEKLNRTVSQFEWIFHTLASLLFGCSGILMMPFIEVYTSGVDDVSYIEPVFSWVITFAYFFCSLRCFYNIIVKAAGHYKQTQRGAMIEAVMNIVISVAVVWKFGLIGVAAGTLAAMAYRTFYFAEYLKEHIIFRSLKHFYKHLAVDGFFFLLLKITTDWVQLRSVSYTDWVLMAVEVLGVAVVELLVINLIFYQREVKSVVQSVFHR